MAGDGAVAAADISARAEALLSRCRRLGVQPSQLRRLTGYGRLVSEPAEQQGDGCDRRRRRWLLPAALVVLAAVLLHQELYTVAGLSRLLFRLEGISDHAEQVRTRSSRLPGYRHSGEGHCRPSLLRRRSL